MRRAFPLLLFLCLGCVESTPPSITLGTGWESFEPLVEGQIVPLVYGLQGGWHLDVSARVEGLEPEGAELRYEAREEGERISFPAVFPLAERLVLQTERGWERLGDRVVLDISADTDALGHAVELWVEVVANGERWNDALDVQIAPGP